MGPMDVKTSWNDVSIPTGIGGGKSKALNVLTECLEFVRELNSNGQPMLTMTIVLIMVTQGQCCVLVGLLSLRVPYIPTLSHTPRRYSRDLNGVRLWTYTSGRDFERLGETDPQRIPLR